MKKNYFTPLFEIIQITAEDIVTASVGAAEYDASKNDYIIDWNAGS